MRPTVDIPGSPRPGTPLRTIGTSSSPISTPGRRGGLFPLVALGALLVASLLVPATSPATDDAAARPAQDPVRTVVIDPGHGGSETGAVGPSGLTEAEVVLDIALRLRDLIARRLGIRVVLTRQDDRDVPLDHRTEIANNFKADLFLSIHANSYRGSSVRGPETYFLSSEASDEEARRTAGLENDPLGIRETAPDNESLQLLLWDMAQTLYLRESSALAEMIQAELNELSGIDDRGVKQAPFRVLTGALMPAVLVEVGFLSNPGDEERLADPDYRQRIVDSLFRSIAEFRRREMALAGGRVGR